MKRNTTILCLAIALLVTCCLLPSGCSPGTSQSTNDTIPEMKTTQLPELNMHDFTLEQFRLWEDATIDWIADDFVNGCLKNAGFKQDCHDCGNVNVGVKITVDASGKITAITEQDLNIDCGRRTEQERQAVKACMIESFQKVNLPAPFRDRVLVVSIGRSTLC
jgi:hypothetical protein